MKLLKVMILMSMLIFVGCGKTNTVIEPQEQTVSDQNVENQDVVGKTSIDEEPEKVKVSGDYTFGMYQITLPNEWVEFEETEIDGLHIWALESESGIAMQMSVVQDEDKVVDQESIKEEVALDSYLTLIEETEIKINDDITFYGAFVEDHATESQFYYLLAKVDTDVIAVIFNNPRSYTNVDIELMDQIIKSFKMN